MTLKDLIQVGVELAESERDPESAALYIEKEGVPADAIAELAKRYATEALGVRSERHDRDIRSCDREDGQPPYLSREDEEVFAETVGL